MGGNRRCSRDTYPKSFITKYTSIRRQTRKLHTTTRQTHPSAILSKSIWVDTLLSTKEGTTRKFSRTLTSKTAAESGLDCLICAIFAQQRILLSTETRHCLHPRYPAEAYVFVARRTRNLSSRNTREERGAIGRGMQALVRGLCAINM